MKISLHSGLTAFALALVSLSGLSQAQAVTYKASFSVDISVAEEIDVGDVFEVELTLHDTVTDGTAGVGGFFPDALLSFSIKPVSGTGPWLMGETTLSNGLPDTVQTFDNLAPFESLSFRIDSGTGFDGSDFEQLTSTVDSNTYTLGSISLEFRGEVGGPLITDTGSGQTIPQIFDFSAANEDSNLLFRFSSGLNAARATMIPEPGSLPLVLFSGASVFLFFRRRDRFSA